jgi:hypothetical protein
MAGMMYTVPSDVVVYGLFPPNIGSYSFEGGEVQMLSMSIHCYGGVDNVELLAPVVWSVSRRVVAVRLSILSTN